MASPADRSVIVTLRNGTRVGAGQAIAVMGQLEHLRRQGLHGQILLGDLYRLCRGRPGRAHGEMIVQALIGAGLLEGDGKPSEPVRNVALSAIVRSKRTRVLRLRKPYQESPDNLAAVDRAADHLITGLGLQHLFARRGEGGRPR